MSPQEFATKIRAKYPDAVASDGRAYADISDDELTKKIVEKYPVYQSQVKMPSDEGMGAFAGNAGQKFNDRVANAETIADSWKTGKTSFASGALQEAGNAAGALGDFGMEFIKSVLKPEAKAAIAQGAQDVLSHPIIKGLIEKANELAAQHPEAAGNLGALVDIGSVFPAGKAAKIGVEAAEAGPAVLAKDIGAGLNSAKTTVKAAAKTKIGALKTTVQTAAGNGSLPMIEGVGQQAKTSATRLAQDAVPAGMGAAIKPTPVQMYDRFAQQEGKHLADIKHDPAISLVGDRIGKAFTNVVKQRQLAGKTMAAELVKTADKAVDTKAPFGALQRELLDNGVTYDAAKKEIVPGAASKFSEADLELMQKYASELQKLGDKPSMAALDAFVSRIPKDIQGLKATRNITFNTNAERIIGSNLDHLREALGAAGTPEYKQARTAYAQLSQFIDEGASHLGKITQSGDFAKDASMAKSAVQSVLNNGKKDWLIKLEKLSGYPALDEATLALQAMKDAGDFKGNSLLELLTDGASGAAAGPHGALAKMIIGFTRRQVSKTMIGSKAEQTRAFLKSLEDKKP